MEIITLIQSQEGLLYGNKRALLGKSMESVQKLL